MDTLHISSTGFGLNYLPYGYAAFTGLFEANGVKYSHIMDPRTGRPARGVLSVAVLASSGMAGDALDDALFVLGPEGSRGYLRRLSGVEALYFLPAEARGWTLVRRRAGH